VKPGQGLVEGLRPLGVARGIEHEHHHAGNLQCLLRAVHQHPVHQPALLMQSRGVQKNDLSVRIGQNAGDLVARGLGLGRDNGYLLPQQGVEQGRFTRIGRPGQDGEAAATFSVLHESPHGRGRGPAGWLAGHDTARSRSISLPTHAV